MPVLVTDLTFSHQLRHIYVIVLLIYALWNLVISWELASALKESKERFDSAGVKLIAVGIGSPNKARMLANRVSSEASFVIMAFPAEVHALESNTKISHCFRVICWSYFLTIIVRYITFCKGHPLLV